MPVIKGSLKTPFARFQAAFCLPDLDACEQAERVEAGASASSCFQAARSFRPRQPENPAHPTRPQNFALLQK
ncbi:hypothetical protein [Kingella oralis]|jgi:hypothetical protein|uniref:hypothetical protein n=1 Tax=Kingella oralis TaxID=505 RepID=UPI0025997EEA|nr:hypothetical protein [Kingella oralis]